MRKAVFGILAVTSMALLACGNEPISDQSSSSIADPAIGVDEDAVCASPSWYCGLIGAIGMSGALGTCGTANSDGGVGVYPDNLIETITSCQVDGTQWNVHNGSQNNIGGIYCNVTQLDTYNWRVAVPAGQVICKTGYTHQYVNCGYTVRSTFENHFVHSDACPTGWVQCEMSHTETCTRPPCC